MNDNPVVQADLFRMICEEEIGSGIARTVYTSKVAPGAVVKIEDGYASFQNVIEWNTWESVKHTDLAKWFAPCLHISGNGAILVMARTEPATEFPDKMPAFLTDFKRANYGMLNGRLVCHDYGVHLMLENGMTKRMSKAEWWDLHE